MWRTRPDRRHTCAVSPPRDASGSDRPADISARTKRRSGCSRTASLLRETNDTITLKVKGLAPVCKNNAITDHKGAHYNKQTLKQYSWSASTQAYGE